MFAERFHPMGLLLCHQDQRCGTMLRYLAQLGRARRHKASSSARASYHRRQARLRLERLESRTVLTAVPMMADIIFIVDESESMTGGLNGLA